MFIRHSCVLGLPCSESPRAWRWPKGRRPSSSWPCDHKTNTSSWWVESLPSVQQNDSVERFIPKSFGSHRTSLWRSATNTNTNCRWTRAVFGLLKYNWLFFYLTWREVKTSLSTTKCEEDEKQTLPSSSSSLNHWWRVSLCSQIPPKKQIFLKGFDASMSWFFTRINGGTLLNYNWAQFKKKSSVQWNTVVEMQLWTSDMSLSFCSLVVLETDITISLRVVSNIMYLVQSFQFS